MTLTLAWELTWPISKCITILIKQEEDLPQRPLPEPGKVSNCWILQNICRKEQVYQSRFIKCREELPGMWKQQVGEEGENRVM